MPIVFGGEWWNQNTRPILKVRAGAVTADVEQADLETCAVTCAALGALVVSSEKASVNLVTRSYEVTIVPPEPSGLLSGGTSIGGWTTAYTVWRPLVPITVKRVQAYILDNYQHACNDSLTLYGNAGTSIGDIYFCGLATAIAGGTRVAGGNLNLVALPGCTDVLVKWAVSTCSVAKAVTVQLDYQTTG